MPVLNIVENQYFKHFCGMLNAGVFAQNVELGRLRWHLQ